MNKTIIVRTPDQVRIVTQIIESNYAQMMADGRPMAVHIIEHKETRSSEANRYYWLRLNEIAAQAWIGGRQYNADIWHEHCKQTFLPEDSGPSLEARKGYEKWADKIDGTRFCVGTTTKLTTYGMARYVEQVEAFGADLGVRFSANPQGF